MNSVERPEDWRFDDPPNVAVITTRDVVNEGKTILFVFHNDEDGYWQFHCDPEPKEEEAMVVSLALIVLRDPSVRELADLPYGWQAWRERYGSEWHRCSSPDVDEDQ